MATDPRTTSRTTASGTTELSPSRRPRADAIRNRERVLDAARRMLAEHGPDAPLEEVARAAGVGIGTLYRHFPTRDALLDAVFRGSVDELCDRGDALLDDPSDPAGTLRRWLRGQFDHSTTYRALAAAVMLSQLDDPTDAPPCARLRSTGAQLLRRAQAAGEVRADVDVDDVLRLVNAVALASEETGDEPDRSERSDRLLAVVFDGLRADGPAKPGAPAAPTR